MFILPLIGMSATQAEYKIVDIRRESVFAGKLGQRVSEELVVTRGGTQILIHVAGSYHTMCVRPGQRLQVGDTVTIRGEIAGDDATVARGRIAKA